MSRERAIRTLKSLRDEVYLGYTASPSSLLRHAMMIVAGESLSEPERLSSWTEYGVVDRGLTIYPIKRMFVCGIDQCYFGHVDAGAIARFENQAKGIFLNALEVLGREGREYKRPPYGVEGWTYLCYCMAWDYPDRVNYKILDDSRFISVCYGTKGPFADRAAFTSWSKGSAHYGEGRFFVKLSLDVRSCLVSVIDVILSQMADAEASATRPKRRLDPSREARNQWIIKQYLEGTQYKKIESDLTNQDPSWDPVTVQRISQIIKKYIKSERFHN